MGVRSFLARLAAGAPVPVFPVVGEGGRPGLRRLALAEQIELADSPRAASVLLVIGRLPRALWAPALQVHDQLAAPRATVVWAEEPCAAFPRATVVGPEDDPVAAAAGAYRGLLAGEGAGDEHLLLDVDPNPWRGVGPYGQGGKGMTGGTPYGRPMTGRASDRDGLELDQLPLRVGPFLPALPPGLVLDVKLQGDVVQEATVGDNPFARAPDDPPLPPGELAPFERALVEPVAIADLEVARARHHLVWLGEALRLQGLAALGERARRLAAGLTMEDRRSVARMRRLVEQSQVLRWSVGRVPIFDAAAVSSRGVGPVARAAGWPQDARQLDPSYRALDFEPIVHTAGDVAARWRQRLAEVDQALDLASRAGDRRTTPVGVVESPRGPIAPGSPPPSQVLLELVGDLVAGLEWGDALATIASLDVDVEEAARPVGAAVAA